MDGNPLVYINLTGLAGRPGLGSRVESHNGCKNHAHLGQKSDPRAYAVNKDGSVRHGKDRHVCGADVVLALESGTDQRYRQAHWSAGKP